MKPQTQKFLQKRRFYMVLPLLILPFTTMIFWALGGGPGKTVQAKENPPDGLNVDLPDAHFGAKEIWDKLTLYEMADRDSAKFREARRNDPYYDLIQVGPQHHDTTNRTQGREDKLIAAFPAKENQTIDINEQRVNQKISDLYRELNKAPASAPTTRSESQTSTMPDPQFTSDVDRLERMMELMSDPEPDPEIQQITDVLEKILDIQHPERVNEKIRKSQQHAREHTLPVGPAKAETNVSLMQSPTMDQSISRDDSLFYHHDILQRNVVNGFFGLGDEQLSDDDTEGGMQAAIHDTQELLAGATVKLRLLNDIHINGKTVPKGQLIYGVCAVNGERLTVNINSIRSGNTLLPVALSVYDLDGLEGIYVPGAITRDAAKQASGDIVQNMQLLTLDPSLGAQAASAGLEAAKGLFSKKVRLVKVTVKAGYQVLLKNTRDNFVN